VRAIEFFDRATIGLLVIDVQERLFPKIDRGEAVLANMVRMVRGFQLLNLPIVATEQYPKGLGPTVPELRQLLGSEQTYFEKTSFSCGCDSAIIKQLDRKRQWLLIGIETHVCVLQTAKDLLARGKSVAIANDCVSSRSIFDYSTGLAEARDAGARITSLETALFELVRDSKAAEFKEISQLVK
jgi:nicotinamidase-related amidase